jgi:hypothetical protein
MIASDLLPGGQHEAASPDQSESFPVGCNGAIDNRAEKFPMVS